MILRLSVGPTLTLGGKFSPRSALVRFHFCYPRESLARLELSSSLISCNLQIRTSASGSMEENSYEDFTLN